MRRVRGIEETLMSKRMLLPLATLAWCACGVHGDARASVLRQSAVRPQVADIAAAGDASPARVAPMQLADSDGASQVGGPQIMSNCAIANDIVNNPDEECSEQASQQGTPPATEADEAEGQLSKELDSGEPESTGAEAEAEDQNEDVEADAEAEDAEVEDAEDAENEGDEEE